MEIPIFFIAIIGAFFIYFFNMRNSKRLVAIIEHPKDNFRMIIFDLIVFLLLAGIFVHFVICPISSKEAFLAGATWEATAHALINNQNQDLNERK